MMLRVLLCLFLLFAPPLQAKALSYPLRVVATFSVLGDFAQIVGGDKVKVISLAELDESPHNYKPKPYDLRSIERSDLLIANGMGMEGWLAPLLVDSKESVRVVNAATGIRPRPGLKGGIDPHAWMDVANGALYVENVRDALVAIDPLNAPYYKDNAETYLFQLKKLDHTIRIQIGRLKKKAPILVNHDSFGYFAQAYGLRIVPLQGIEPQLMPAASDFPEAMAQIKKPGISFFFTENTDSPRVMNEVQSLSKGSTIVGKLYADALSKDAAAANYLAMMRSNADAIFETLNK
jgi:zinc/manganese transport system substrate-binding protein